MSGGLIFPEEILRQHLVILGKTGAGKSSALRHIVEHLLSEGKRVCVIDPKGDWWGLKSSADGKGPGFPVIAFGDFKEPKASDVPINDSSGRHVAELITSGNRPCVIGFRGWMTSHMVRFWIDFAPGIFNANSGELYLVGDEFHNFAPKGKIMDPDAGKCLHYSNRLMSEGRGLGIVCLIASQRPQKVHNDTLTSCETLVAMRVVHKSDRDAVQDWIEGCGDMAQGKEVLNSLAGMARGEAFVWSPEIGFGPKRLTFPMFKTFDSFAPPQLQKKVVTSTWANVDLEAVKVKLARVIEEQKSNDPGELKRIIADLKRRLVQAEQKKPDAQQAPRVEVPAFTTADRHAMEALATALRDFFHEQRTGLHQQGERLQRISTEALKNLECLKRVMTTKEGLPFVGQPDAGVLTLDQVREMRGRPVITYKEYIKSNIPEGKPTNGAEIGGGLKRMMIALAQRPGLTKKQLGVRAGLSSTSGTFGTYLARMRSTGWVEGSDRLELTEAGRATLGHYKPLPEGQELLRYWLDELGNSAAGRMLQVLAEAYPEALTKEELGQTAGISHSSGTFGTYLARLRTLELVEGRGELRASKEFFE
ncbi:MAG TPA: DUF87 domain-containing protein [Verrucomicrobiae bacterium]|nr:DUF87 domain-containing protein [Verrucomicrobiae bacterium]